MMLVDRHRWQEGAGLIIKQAGANPYAVVAAYLGELEKLASRSQALKDFTNFTMAQGAHAMRFYDEPVRRITARNIVEQRLARAAAQAEQNVARETVEAAPAWAVENGRVVPRNPTGVQRLRRAMADARARAAPEAPAKAPTYAVEDGKLVRVLSPEDYQVVDAPPALPSVAEDVATGPKPVADVLGPMGAPPAAPPGPSMEVMRTSPKAPAERVSVPEAVQTGLVSPENLSVKSALIDAPPVPEAVAGPAAVPQAPPMAGTPNPQNPVATAPLWRRRAALVGAGALGAGAGFGGGFAGGQAMNTQQARTR